MMTRLLEKAFDAASKLPEEEQDAFAEWILAELTSEQRWEEAFAHSEDALSKLADEVIREYRLGETQEFDPDQL
jgi:hypothetical protein